MLIAVYTHIFFCHWFSFGFYLLLVLLFFFQFLSCSLSLSLPVILVPSLFTLHSVNSTGGLCVRACSLYFVLLKDIKRISLTEIRTDVPFHISISFTLYSNIGDLPFYACKRVRLCIYRCMCVCLWETLSISVSKYSKLFNVNEAVKRYLFYEKTSTRSDQRRQRVHTTRLPIKKKYRACY